MASNCSVICSGFIMSSSLDDSGCEEARASTAKTRCTSLRTIRSFWEKGKRVKTPQRKKSVQVDICWLKTHHIPWWFGKICTKIWHVRGKTFIQPNFIPPTQSHKIAKPLNKTTNKPKKIKCWSLEIKPFNMHLYHVSQFMSYNGGCSLFVCIRGHERIIQKVCLSVGHQAPVLHRPKVKIR